MTEATAKDCASMEKLADDILNSSKEGSNQSVDFLLCALAQASGFPIHLELWMDRGAKGKVCTHLEAQPDTVSILGRIKEQAAYHKPLNGECK